VRLRPPDWLVYGAIVATVLAAALGWRERVAAPEPPPPVPGAAQLPLAADSPFVASAIVPVRRAALRQARTAFSVGESGIWVSGGARPGARPGVVVAGGRAVQARAGAAVGGLRILTTTGAGTPSLPIAAARDVRLGELGFHVGYPQDGPGEVASRLLGTRTLRSMSRTAANTPVLAWAEIGHTEGLKGARMGLIGAPVLDGEGRVVGVMVGQSPRRGRLYTTTTDGLRNALAAARAPLGAPGPGQPIGADNYGRAADDLRRDLRVVQLVCLAR
jgi:serine protease Do